MPVAHPSTLNPHITIMTPFSTKIWWFLQWTTRHLSTNFCENRQSSFCV